jgi:RNA polymerase sigma-70 factor (ECF subfamily)
MAPPSAERDDAELLEVIRKGDHAAFAALVQRHTDRFYRLAYRHLRSRPAAEDVVQDAFLKIWEDPTRWRAERKVRFTSWFHRVVVNLCLDRLRKKSPQPSDAIAEWPDLADSVDVALDRRAEQQLLEREIDALPVRQRVALQLCFDQDLSNQEAADAMGLKLKALQSLLMRAKTTLRERMKAIL